MSSDSDRVSELESRVKELEATVRGLTEELVDANERIRELEDYHDAHESAGRPASEPLAAGAPEEDADADANADASGEAADAAADGEGAKGAEGEDTTTEEESGMDDIIVA
ncbi:hypothetical protein EFA46_006205 [Halarchaeum sp. CBA1220]|uniref:DUF7518 family protein n=1 Tax=Halarchaeum sp. CBA1220 TaxID=1853682 RepID=UPI000F3A9883|nr:hypothetical protein [Halarchaeum sp. CBA1220]QLC33806.1 hypothetical protein EFA46_006205 [Halarchaeum sp. CBA1220]